jgi:AraC family transcriptional regulator
MALPELRPGRLGRYLGEVSVAGARVNCATYPARLTTPMHVHPHGDVCFLLRGLCEESWRGSGHSIRAGHVVIKPPGTEHVDRFGPRDVTCLNIDLSHAAWEETFRGDVRVPRVLADPGLACLASRLELELTTPDSASPLPAEELVLALMAAVVRAEPVPHRGPERWLDTVRERLHEEYRCQLRLDDLAASAGVHASHLARRFRRRFGRSVGTYVRDLRVAAALRGLAEHDRALADIAVEAGFSDQSHMGRVLRSATGATPGAWRARFPNGRRAPGSKGIGSF